jgi:hypothetical protein
MTMALRCLRRPAIACLFLISALVSRAGGLQAAAAQPLRPVGPPVTLAGASNPFAGGPESERVPLAVSPLDGSIELATLQPVDTLFSVATMIVVQHFDASGQPGPVIPASAVVGNSQDAPFVASLTQGGFVVTWENSVPQGRILGGPLPPVSPALLRSSGSPRSPRSAAAEVSRVQGSALLPSAAGDPNTVSGRLFDATGRPLSPEIQLSPDGALAAGVRVAALSSGGFVATWRDQSTSGSPAATLVATLFDATGHAQTAEIPLAAAGRNLGLVGHGDGGFAAAWGGVGGAGLFWQRFNAGGVAVGPAVEVAGNDAGGPVLLAGNPAGQLAFAWMTTDPTLQPLTAIRVQLFGAGGAAVAPAATVAASGPGGNPSLGGLAVNLEGLALVAWSNVMTTESTFAMAQLLDASGAPTGTAVPVNSQLLSANIVQGVMAGEDGSWSLLSTDFVNAYLQRQSSAACSSSALSVCLDANRFRLDVQFSNPLTGSTATGHPVPLTADTGALWFFDPSNPELVVKLIDGTAVNGHFWVFLASLTDVEFDLTVTDTQTGAQRVYHNPAGTLASQADTGFPLTGTATAPPPPTAPAASARPAPSATASDQDSPSNLALVCNSSLQALCLAASEFSVQVTFQETAGAPASAGQAVQLSGEGGYFWFFGPNDVELSVKILDGRAINGHVWVFYGSLTNVAFDLTVVDNFSPTHASRTYHNPAGTLASAADTGAF